MDCHPNGICRFELAKRIIVIERGSIMAEKRKLRRKRATYYMKVVDQKTNRLAGNVHDISPSGFMMNSPRPIKTHVLHDLSMSLPDTIEGEIPIIVQAKSVWCSKNEITKLYDTGFKLVNVTPEEQDIIKSSLNSYLFKE